MSKRDVQISKVLSLVLRHKPEEVGITLDAAGWVGVDTLLAATAAHGVRISGEELDQVVAKSDKQRFAFSEDRTRIRANQGHSVEVELGYEPADPPETLYHGTAEKFLDSIRRQGLLKRARHHVHLSPTRETASAVGSRHGKLVLLTVRSGAMHRDGHAFYKTPNDVWLTDRVPVEYLVFPDETSDRS
ncbi:MAG TPA: RNA 2'-phosphotransferase [Tepidisphaeraceae bacterium]|nr:RNA 2'-phosphotransferase [Tepidisphaeraceae bacterium]